MPNQKPQPIRNSRIKREMKRLLEIIVDAREADFSEVEAIAKRNGFEFDDEGRVKEVRG